MTSASRELFRAKYYTAAVQRLTGAVLELGCGRKPRPAQYGGDVRVTAVDISPRRVRLARQRLKKLSVDFVDVMVADATSLPFPNASFDGIAVSFTLCSVESVDRVAQELSRVAKPGALLVLLEHVRSVIPLIGVIQDVVSPLYRLGCNNCHLNRNPRASLEAHGFIIDEARHMAHLIPWLFLAGVRRDGDWQGER